jgi:hypothetical protein
VEVRVLSSAPSFRINKLALILGSAAACDARVPFPSVRERCAKRATPRWVPRVRLTAVRKPRASVVLRSPSQVHFLKFLRAPVAINPGIFSSGYRCRIAVTRSSGVAADSIRRSKSARYDCMNVRTSGVSGAARSAL